MPSLESIPNAAARIAARLDGEDVRWFRAPGRVNLIGDHTDYNDGFVLPLAIDRDCVVAARPSATVRMTSLDLGGEVEASADASGGAADGCAVGWGRLVVAVVRELGLAGRPHAGMDGAVASDVPIGSGLSSSAAFEVACAVALADFASWSPEPPVLAAACRAAEERAFGELVRARARDVCRRDRRARDSRSRSRRRAWAGACDRRALAGRGIGRRRGSLIPHIAIA